MNRSLEGTSRPAPAPRANAWFARVLAINFLSAAIVHGMRPIASYRVLALDGGAVEVGLVAASYGVLSLLIAIPAGRWVDRFGQPRFLLLGLLTVVLSGVLAVFSTNVAVLALAMAMLGVGQIVSAVAFQTMIASGGDPEGRDGRFGAQTVNASLGQLIGPAVAALLVGGAIRAGDSGAAHQEAGATDIVFLAGALAALIACAVAISLWRWPPPMHTSVKSENAVQAMESTRQAVGRVLRTRSMPEAMLASLTVLSCVDILVAYLPAYGAAAGISVETVGLLLAVRAGASMLSRAVMLPLRRLLGRRQLLAASMLLPAVTLVALPFGGTNLVFLVTVVALIGFGLGLGQPLSLSWVATRAPADIRATALAVRLAANRVGQMGLPAAVGVLAGAAGLSAIFWSLSGLLGLTAVLVARAPFDPLPDLEPNSGDRVESTKA